MSRLWCINAPRPTRWLLRCLVLPGRGPGRAMGDDRMFHTWIATKDGDPSVFPLFQRHYSARKNGRNRRNGDNNNMLFVGPGQKMILTTLQYDALFAWRIQRLRRDEQCGIECVLFRNESRVLSSTLIIDAMDLAFARWPQETRLFTFVRPASIRSTNPGYCFLCAGWQRCGRSQSGLVILEYLR